MKVKRACGRGETWQLIIIQFITVSDRISLTFCHLVKTGTFYLKKTHANSSRKNNEPKDIALCDGFHFVVSFDGYLIRHNFIRWHEFAYSCLVAKWNNYNLDS